MDQHSCFFFNKKCNFANAELDMTSNVRIYLIYTLKNEIAWIMHMLNSFLPNEDELSEAALALEHERGCQKADSEKVLFFC